MKDLFQLHQSTPSIVVLTPRQQTALKGGQDSQEEDQEDIIITDTGGL